MKTSTPTVLLTGATGFIGGAALSRLLELRPDCRVLTLVRGKQGGARLRASLARFVDPDRLGELYSRCELLHADLTDAATLDAPALDEVTHVLHLASNTSFRSVRGVRQVNIFGTLVLAHRLRRVAGLQRFVHVGTAYVCGDDAERVVREDDHPQPGAGHLVEYTRSKAEAELLLEHTAPELPLVIARPSVVIGHTRLGCRPSASIFWFYRVADLLRRLTCGLDTCDDIIPVDYAADALLYLLFKPQLVHRRYHVSAGESRCVTWREIAQAFAQCHGARADNPYRTVKFETLMEERSRLRPLLGPGDEDHLLMALQAYYRFMGLRTEIFDNSRLLAEGMAPPPRFTDYLALCATSPPGRSVYEQMRDDE